MKRNISGCVVDVYPDYNKNIHSMININIYIPNPWGGKIGIFTKVKRENVKKTIIEIIKNLWERRLKF